MSVKRMDDEAFDARQEFCRRGEADRHTQRLIAVEAGRARSAEAEKDAVIKALADALEAARRCVAPETRTWDMAGAALRLAGRLP